MVAETGGESSFSHNLAVIVFANLSHFLVEVFRILRFELASLHFRNTPDMASRTDSPSRTNNISPTRLTRRHYALVERSEFLVLTL
jgi:hypothetical protein